jgi:PKHD-type hydroxylase
MYTFLPSPSFALATSFATWENGFNDDEIDEIIRLGEIRRPNEAKVGSTDGLKVNETIRKSKVSWLTNEDETLWVYDRLAFIARKLNGQFFNFDLFGFAEALQYTIYDGTENGHYDAHVDISGPGGDLPQRKLSLVLQLSDPEKYEGGELQIYSDTEPTSVKKQKGLVVAFPSYLLHKVTPVTSGVRRTLVTWTSGPAFR